MASHSTAQLLMISSYCQLLNMHKALTLSEILNLIFAFLPRSANATNARVCKTWSDSALDDVWYEIPDVSKVFQALAATVVSNGKLVSLQPFVFDR